jgi:hypothetical protein
MTRTLKTVPIDSNRPRRDYMNRKITTTLCKLTTVLGLSVLAVSLSQAAEPRSYPMMCKGGGDTSVSIDSLAGMDGLSVKIGISKSSRPATSGLNAGECAWMDRGINPSEPGTIALEVSDVYAQAYMKVSTGGDNYRISFYGNGTKVADLKRLIESIKQGREYQVHAYNNKRGQFTVTRVGP